MERSNAFREPSEASIRHLSEIDDPDLDILISSNNDVLRSRMLEEIQDHEIRPKSRSGSFGSQVDSLYSSDSDPNKSIADLKELLSPNRELPYRPRIDREYSGSPMGSFSSRVDSLYKSDPSQTSNLLINNEEIDNDLKSLRVEALNEICTRPRSGGIYNDITYNFERIMERMEYLSKKEESFTIDEAIEINNAGYLLGLFKRDEVFWLPGEMANNAVLSILQAEKLIKKGHNLLDRSKSMLQLAIHKPDAS